MEGKEPLGEEHGGTMLGRARWSTQGQTSYECAAVVDGSLNCSRSGSYGENRAGSRNSEKVPWFRCVLSMWVVKERQKSKVMAGLLSWAQDRILEPFVEEYGK